MGNSRGPRVSIGRPAGWAAPGGACGFGEPPKPTPEQCVVPKNYPKPHYPGTVAELFSSGQKPSPYAKTAESPPPFFTKLIFRDQAVRLRRMTQKRAPAPKRAQAVGSGTAVI